MILLSCNVLRVVDLDLSLHLLLEETTLSITALNVVGGVNGSMAMLEVDRGSLGGGTETKVQFLGYG